jgi:mono/diheme cytochrome c family protein
MGMARVALVTGMTIAAVVSASAQAPNPDVEKGRQTVQQVCVACHNNALRMIQSMKRSPDQWRDTVYSMIGRNAQVFPDDIEPLVAFLAATSSRPPEKTAAASGSMPRGRAVLEQACQECHDLEKATTKPADKDWSTVLTAMTMYGAKVSAADQQALIEYLNTLSK